MVGHHVEIGLGMLCRARCSSSRCLAASATEQIGLAVETGNLGLASGTVEPELHVANADCHEMRHTLPSTHRSAHSPCHPSCPFQVARL